MNDGISKHADNNQGESTITTAIISQDVPRNIIIDPLGRRNEFQHNDDRYRLFLETGDVLMMDGEMQLHYGHSVPKSKSKQLMTEKRRRRLAIVFRDGKRMDFERDSGESVEDFTPRSKLKRRFGEIGGLEYGSVHRRTELGLMGAHVGNERSVSGSSEQGCDSLIVSSRKSLSLQWDAFFVFTFCARSTSGAGALLTVSPAKCFVVLLEDR